MASQIRQNYHEDCEASINKHINLELYASYVYLSMANYFDRDDISLPGMFKFFKDNSDEEKEHAEKLIKYQNKRGGRVVLHPIAAPKNEWASALEALQTALDLEKQVNQALLNLHKTAGDKTDAHLSDFIEDEYLGEQVEAIRKLGDMITQLKRCGQQGLGEYLFDKDQQ